MAKNDIPMYRQYMDIKNRNMDSIVLIQVGHFYYAYYYDSVIVWALFSYKRSIVALGEGRYAQRCGIPCDSIENAATTLANHGYNAVLCPQVKDGVTGKYYRKVSKRVVAKGDDKYKSVDWEEQFKLTHELSQDEHYEFYKLKKPLPRVKAEEKSVVSKVDYTNPAIYEYDDEFLGWKFFLTDTGKVVRKVKVQTKLRVKRNFKAVAMKYRSGECDIAHVKQVVMSYKGYLKHGNTFQLRKYLFQNLYEDM